MKESLREIFIEYGVKLNLEKGALFSREDEQPENQYVYWLEDGICALMEITKEGKEWTYLYFHAQRLVAFSKVIASQKGQFDTKELYLVAKTFCTVYRLTDHIFLQLITNHPQFNALVLRTLADNYDELLIHFHRINSETTAAGLCRLLLDTSALRDGRRVLPRFFTYSEIARYLGTHTVTVSRIMAKLIKKGFITKTGRVIVIEQEDGLQKVIQSESYLHY